MKLGVGSHHFAKPAVLVCAIRPAQKQKKVIRWKVFLFLNLANMWTCPQCRQQFKNTNQVHSCNDKTLADFFKGKSPLTVELFRHFAKSFQQLGLVTLHPTKSMIAFAANKRMAYVTRLGKNFVDITFPFAEPYYDNLCFHKIAQVPGQQQFNHHFRMYSKDDINDEVLYFMKLAWSGAL